MADITLLIVDDHPVVRDGLRGMFAATTGFEVLAEAADGREAVALPDPTRRGLPCKVLVLTTYDTDTDTIPAIEAGATGYLLKDAPRDDLFNAVRAAAE